MAGSSGGAFQGNDGRTEPGLDAIFFDIDDTLYSSTALAANARAAAIEAMTGAGLRAEPARVGSLLAEIISDYTSNFPYQFDELLERLPAETYRPVNRAVIVASAVAAYHDTKFRELRPYEDVPAVLAGLKRRGLRAGVVTAGVPVKQAEKLVRMGVVDCFVPDWIFITDQMELTKQDPRLWREVLRRAGVRPERAAHVGDHPVQDIDAPNEAGMVTFLIRRGGKYESLEGRTPPRHEVKDLHELDAILRDEYGV